ncbi:uncharacterized protein LOC132707668 [Cylas formicarius]|uniref:uncharacterized protein LOC132707668 n=1 Tax=Cylas formicarius TaxID=197179 RepID=UPI002958AE0C|nr:uncharacterized protein LOC132707668 [Cylas formicarius]
MLVIFVVIAVPIFLYVYAKWKYSYWKRRGVEQPEPEFPFGNFRGTILKKMTFEATAGIYYNIYKKSHKYVGLYMFTAPLWLVMDLTLIKRILQQDFQHFTDHFSFHHDTQILTNHLFSIEGDKWKTLRAKMTPTFTSGKMKMMFSIVYDLSTKLESSVLENHIQNPKSMSIRDTVARFSTDVIASCAFGLETNCIDNPDTEFRKYGRRAFHPNKLRILEQIVNWNLLARLGYLRYPTDATNFFLDVVKKTVEFREKNNVLRNDFVQLLLQLKNKGKLEDGGDISKTGEGIITDNDVAAMMFLFYLAGFETSSTTTSFLFYELASHEEIQDKLRQEIKEVSAKYGGKLTYEALQEMHYAQMCIDETLRLYPPVPFHTRVCTKAYKVPEADLVIEKGTQVIIPVISIQHDRDIYRNPEEFNPENFSEGKKKNRISSAWLPFGDGPRQCIGMRFGYMQVKLSIAALLKNFKYRLHESTPKKLEFMMDVLALRQEKEILLNVSRKRAATINNRSFKQVAVVIAMLLILFVLAVSVSLYFYVKWKYTYWERRGVAQAEVKFPFGSFKHAILKKMTLEQNIQLFYKKFKDDQRYFGMYLFFEPVWIVTDLHLIKRIMQPDFQHFTDHNFYHHDKEMLTNHLFNLEGERWRTLRAKLTPTFTSGKMKMMYSIVYQMSKILESLVEKHVTANKPLVIRDAAARYSTDVIASCAFGLETNCLTEQDAPFRYHGKKIFESRPLKALLEQFVNWNVLAALGFRFFPEDSTKFFLDVVNDTIEYREKNNIQKNDFVHLLLQLKNKGKLDDGGDLTKTSQGTLTYEDVASSMFVFYLAGFETSSSTTSFLFYELAKHQDVQDRLREEVREVLEKHNGKLTYDALQEMHYAQKCIDETLRLYPPAAVHFRRCTKTYQVPDSDLVIKKGVLAILPTFAIQRDPDLFANPEEFNPENFTDEARAGRISSAWTPFGDGPRQCIGMRFGYMQVKTSIVALLKNFRYTLHQSTPTKLSFACDTIALAPAQDIFLNVSRVDYLRATIATNTIAMLLTLFAIAAPVLAYLYVKWKYTYWKRRGVVQPEAKFPFGSFKRAILKKMTLEQNVRLFYEELKGSHKYFGLYLFFQPIWVVTDLNLMKRILQPDFQYFTDHNFYHHDKEMLTNNLFNLEGERWKTLRAKLTPTFTSGKMKMMYGIIYELSTKLESLVENHFATKKPLAIRDVVARFSTDVIASCAFGLQANCLTDPEAAFRQYGRKIFEVRPVKALLEQFVNWNLLAALGFSFFPKDTTKFFLDVVNETINYREKNNIRKNDFVHLLLQLKNTGKLDDNGDITKTSQGILTYEDVASSMFVFYVAGFETSSTTTSFLFYELACNQDIQDRLRDEVREVFAKHKGKLTYEALQEMHYTQKCIDETLRLYPPVAMHFRKCSKRYRVPDSDLVINKGDVAILPVFAIQRDSNIFPNPEKFNPENFSDEARSGRISSAWTPFGDGPRQCIGMRFGYMQIKTSIAVLLRNYRFTLHESTPKKLTFACSALTLTPVQDIVLNISKVD